MDRLCIAMLVVGAVACGRGGTEPPNREVANAPAPVVQPVVRTVAHPVVRRTYAIEHDAARAADVLNQRFAVVREDAAARVEDGKVIVEIGRVSPERMEVLGELARLIGRSEVRAVATDGAVLAAIVQHVAGDRDANARGIFVDRGQLLAINAGVPDVFRSDKGREALATYVAGLPAALQLPPGHALAFEYVTIEGTFTVGPGWRAHELAAPLVDDVQLDVRLDSDLPGLRVTPARAIEAHTPVALVLDGELLGTAAPGASFRVAVADPDRRAQLAALLKTGPLPAKMTYLTAEEL